MDQQQEIVVRLTEKSLSSEQRQRALFDFASSTGWHPSDTVVDYPGTELVANGHLIAEHGLERAAVISFLSDSNTFADLAHRQRNAILSISYNNLIDWHLFPDRHGVTVVFNRESPPEPTIIRRTRNDDLWRVESFDSITERRPSSNLKSLDTALIETISLWRRALAGDLGPDIPNEAYSALFNGIILVRAAEDHRRHRGDEVSMPLLEIAENAPKSHCKSHLEKAMRFLRLDGRKRLVKDILSELDVFDRLDHRSWRDLLGDFYTNRFAPYQYDFSLISKQALSRIYEKYVSVLRPTDSPQLELFSGLASEEHETAFGEVYTPQYIARFFGRFLREEMTPREFRSIKVVDPACGSGIFLRSVLELQCDPADMLAGPGAVESAFENIHGADIDANACFAARLSLSLLHLVLTDKIPSRLNIRNVEAIDYFANRAVHHGVYDAVIANPPFVKWDHLQDVMRQRIVDYLGQQFRGKVDLFSAFLALSLDMVRPGGYLMFVLPHSFLLSESSRGIREAIARSCTVRVLADLTEVPVFEGIGTYVVLLICQKNMPDEHRRLRPNTVYARVQDYVGHALQTVLQRRSADNSDYEVFEVSPDIFSDDPWIVLPHRQQVLMERLKTMPSLSDLCIINQGIVTGADEILIRPSADVSRKERKIWKPLLRDREITRYGLSKTTKQVVFYPFDGDRRLDQSEIQDRYPDTWEYLVENRAKLGKRAPVKRNNCRWWEPAWPRNPSELFGRPKIITPHLSITPRFGLDVGGKFATTRSPYLLAKERSEEISLLKYVSAILNSGIGFWQVLVTSHKYRSGYAMLENKTLKGVHVPDPTSLEPRLVNEILDAVDDRIGQDDPELEVRINRLVSRAYSLTDEEQAEIGIET